MLKSLVLKTLFLITFLFLSFNLICQITQNEDSIRRCGTTEYYQKLKKDPQIKKQLEDAEAKLKEDLAKYQQVNENNHNNHFSLQKSTQRNLRTDDPIDTIPLVFHILLPTNLQSLVTDEVIEKQVEILNQDFLKKNKDTIDIPDVFKPLASKSKIQFALAKISPDNLTTTGITRFVTDKTYTADNFNNAKAQATGGVSPWDITKYINIWVLIFSDKLLGVAVFPFDNTNLQQRGVALDYRTIGNNQVANYLYKKYNKGRTLTHELGHFFNLYHLSGDEPLCNEDDNIDDTPKQKEQNSGVPTFPSTTQLCLPSTFPSTMFMNYLDYSDDTCLNMFTTLQTKMMNEVLYASNNLKPLLTSKTYIDVLKYDNDVLFYKILNLDTTTCNPSMPQISFINRGNKTLNTLTIETYLEKTLLNRYQWNGFLQPRNLSESITINYTLPEIYFGKINIFLKNPNNQQDEDSSNNTKSFNVISCPYTAQQNLIISYSPSNKNVLIRQNNITIEPIQKINVFNVDGQLVKEIITNSGFSSTFISFSVNELAQGNYFIQVLFEKNKIIQSLAIF